MNKLLSNLHTLKQNWPYVRKPTFLPDTDISIPVPDEEHRNRIGRSTPTDFISGGLRDMTCILNISEAYNYLDQYTTIMDWGIGCSRVSRHIPATLRNRFIGVDVDPINIQWCNHNINWGKYEVCEPHGFINVPDNTIDILIGLSVFTHLSEVSQYHWLQEINRIITGSALLSVHGLHSVANTDWVHSPNLFDNWIEHGFVDAQEPNPDISDVTPKGYYRDTAHTPEYIYSNWSKYINIIDIIPGAIGHHHDVVVCRKKA